MKIFTLILSLICLTSCEMSGQEVKNSIKETSNTQNMSGLVILCEHTSGNDKIFRFIRDTYTDNIYINYFEIVAYGGGGSTSPYYNSKGEIMKYDEFQKVHKH